MAAPPGTYIMYSNGQVDIWPSLGMFSGTMARLSGTAPAVPTSDGVSGRSLRRRPWPVWAAAIGCLAGGSALLSFESVASGAGFALAGLAVAVLWGVPNGSFRPGRHAEAWGQQLIERATVGDLDPYLDLDLMEVQAVYCLGTELFAHLRGGIGQRVDPVTGGRRAIETTDVSLTWRCPGRRRAENLVSQLNQWEARGTPLRLLAIKGRSALLIEDDHTWVTLPELRLAA